MADKPAAKAAKGPPPADEKTVGAAPGGPSNAADAKKDGDKKPRLLENRAVRYGIGAAILLLVIAGAGFAGYYTAVARMPAPEIEEEEEPAEAAEAVEVSPEEYRPVQGIDLARERSPEIASGERTIGLDPTMTPRPAATIRDTSIRMPPDSELTKPLLVRAIRRDRIERSIADASASLATAGGLGGVEPLVRRDEGARDSSAPPLVPVPGVPMPAARPLSSAPLPGLYPSTMPTPSEYNMLIAPRRSEPVERPGAP